MSTQHQFLGEAAVMAENITAARHIADLKPIKDVIRMSDKFTPVEKTLLITVAVDRENEIAQAYLAQTIYTGRNSGRH
jgi:hypothetical protein